MNFVEGGIGGMVIVNICKFLDFDFNIFFGSVKVDYGMIFEEIDFEIFGFYSWKNDEEMFGVFVLVVFFEINY